QGRRRKFIDPQHTGKRMPLHFLNILLFPCNDPGLRSAQKLVPAEGDHISPLRKHFLDGRLMAESVLLQIDQHSAAQILQKRDTGPSLKVCQFSYRSLLRKSHDPVIACMNLQESSRLFAYRFLVIREPGPVRGPHLPQLCSAELHHVRHPELSPDLNQLSS